MRGAFIGPLGQLVEIAHYKGSIGAAYDRETSFKPLLGGGRVGFLSPNFGLRTWDVSCDLLDPSQYAPFESLLMGSDGPYVWVDPLAQHTNALTPRASMFASGVSGGSLSGAFTGEDGVRFPVSLTASSGNVYFGQSTPVIPGVQVTGSAYATNGTRFHLHILDAAGAVIASSSVSASAEGQRVTGTVTAPAGAVSARLGVAAGTGPGTVAGPAITWTPSVTPWTLGRGAAQVVAHSLSDDIVLASAGRQFKNLSFTVTEVGTGA